MCDYCSGPIDPDKRADARFCCDAHRSAYHNAENRRLRATVADLRQRLAVAATAGDHAEILRISQEALALPTD